MPGSGSKAAARGDGESESRRLHIECKFTDKDSFILKHADLMRAREQGARKGMEAVFEIEFRMKGRTFVVLSADHFDDLISQKE